MKITAQQLLDDLKKMTLLHMEEANKFLQLEMAVLNSKPDESSWSILECLKHLNRYGDFYLPEIESRIKESNHSKKEIFKSGLLGNYFAKSMLPKEKLNSMKTFKNMNPLNSKLDKSTIDKFIHQQKKMIELLEIASAKNLVKIKTSISISSLIKLRLGDTFRVVIYHNKRHLVQAKKLL